MSDGMEREKNERLTAKEIEEKKNMKKQLIDMGIYDETDTYEQMKHLLGFLSNSETTPNVATDNKHAHKKDNEQHSDNECLSDLAAETESQEQQIVVAQELPKVTCKPSRTSPQQERKNSRHSGSPESSSNSSIFDAQGRKSAENDETASSEKQQHEQSGASRPVPTKSGNDAQECQNSPADAKTMQCATQSTYYQRMERWRMNPLDVCINENDVPLQQPRSRLAARKCAPSSSGCRDKTYTSEQHDQKMRALGQHLREVADLWYSWQRPANAKFEWGVPIEVGTANGSLDRKPVTEPKTELIPKAECAYRDSYERSSKRKANSLIAKECASLNKESSSDEDLYDQYEFARVKKKKIQSAKSNNVTDHANQQHTQTPSGHEAATLTARQQHSHNDGDDIMHIDDEDVKLSRRRKTEDEENERVSPVLITQPKRAVPSTPKARPHLPRLRRGRLSLKIQGTAENREVERTRNQKKDNTMTDEEIRRKLEEDSDGEVAAILQKETRSPKEAKSRLQERQLSSNNGETLRETSTTHQERKSDRQRSGKEKKVDFDEQRKKEDKCEIKSKDVNWERELLDDEESNQQSVSQNGNWHEKVSDSTNNINCPICNKPFPPDEIINHAADCNQFEINDESDDDDINLFKCNVCDSYKTRDELEYNQHVRRCIESRKKHLHESDDDVVSIPSSHYTHKPSSQKGASSNPNIHVMDQSPSHSRTRVFTNRKRKHCTSSFSLSIKGYRINFGLIGKDNQCNMKFFTLVLWISSLISINCQIITLNGVWNGTINGCDIKFTGTVPGGIYTDLYMDNIIDDNLLGKNDVNNRWVGNQSVTYTKDFIVSDDFLRARRIVLIFHGVDTFANITLNNHAIGETSNMFLRYMFDVTNYIEEGKNVLKVAFRSAVKVAEDLYNEQKKSYIVQPVCVPKEYNGICHVNHIRKMQASFSWDWGPAFPSIGIWKDVELVPVNDIMINDVTADIRKKDDTWQILLTIFLEVTQRKSDESQSLVVTTASTLHISQDEVISKTNETMLNTNERYVNINVQLTVPADAVKTWWPNGYGEQNLYYLSTTVTTVYEILHKQIRVGFRTVELVEEPLKKGRSFYFRINNVPIFAKGSNFIPASIFPELGAKEETIRHLLSSAKETHMNMLRVWGGGLYESKLFYDLADEYGIMIWQDFMFACAMYPTTDSFFKNVREEVVQNVIRLKNHPSIVLWAGNNENEAALYGNWYNTGSAEIYRTDYMKLYVNLIKKEVEILDPVRPFLVSSPGNGAYEETYNYTGIDPYLNLYGDVHYYNYLRNGWDVTQYPRTRFCSEYGFQAWPSIYTIATVVESAKDLSIDSDFVKHRQHLPFGNELMKLLISQNLIIPQSNDSFRDFASYIYLSQVNQAVSVKVETEGYRQLKSEVNSIGEGMTMGALYWQLNDVWQAPSWSSIDIEGRWKMLHYYAKDFFAPVIVTSRLTNSDELTIYVVSDQLFWLTNCHVDIRVYNWKSMTPIHTKSYHNVIVPPNKAIQISTFWLDAFLSQAGCGSLESTKKSCVVTLSLTDESRSSIAPVNYIYPTALKNVDITIANVTIRIEEAHLPGKLFNYPDFKLVLTTDNIALFVWLEVGNIRGRFSENGFHMFEQQKEVIFHAQEATTAELLRDDIKMTTLSDIYNARGNFADN
ncbi:beta-mannosidase [Odontomachus brunneus]|uniref:beta-mannosidase n=1 Tax=Odontomachus brunneus TaxID=486640 RepID=UPI0013F273F0|nr:beta-mannosidase [Odontomachus brunneus]